MYNTDNKRKRKSKGQSGIDNPETPATLGTQDTGRRQIKQYNTAQKTKRMSNADRITKSEVNPDARIEKGNQFLLLI